MYNGIINIYKEKGFTSHDVVAKLRGILKQKKIGHTGTLDPDATGVLPVCLGSGTKLCDMLTDKDKTYRATMILGKTTDTQDISGTVLSETELSDVNISEEDILKVIKSFLGEYMQTPPMYSAIKVNGRKLYELAREGITIEVKARQVYINDIYDINIDFPKIEMTVDCSKGTYIRTLCHDIGQALNVGGVMTELVRTKVGAFSIEEALKLDEVTDIIARNQEEIHEYILPVEAAFLDYKAGYLKPEFEKYLFNGNPLLKKYIKEFENFTPEDGECVKMYDCKGKFTGLYIYSKKDKMFKVKKMFL